MKQLSLFPDETPAPAQQPKRPAGGSNNPIVFHDYESYVAKFRDRPKTTDDTFTPPDVYEAVLQYLREERLITPADTILRPFYPGGDYEHADYPPGGIVVDNPPFSCFSRICRFFADRAIPFFLFGPGLTIFTVANFCTAVIIDCAITFSNGAVIKCNFATSLFPRLLATTSPRLSSLIAACPSQNQNRHMPSYAYPAELLSVSDMQNIARGGVPFSVPRSRAEKVRNLDLHPSRTGLFGDHYLIGHDLAEAKEKAKEKAKAKAKQKAKQKAKTTILLSPREQAIVRRLGEKNDGKT